MLVVAAQVVISAPAETARLLNETTIVSLDVHLKRMLLILEIFVTLNE